MQGTSRDHTRHSRIPGRRCRRGSERRGRLPCYGENYLRGHSAVTAGALGSGRPAFLTGVELHDVNVSRRASRHRPRAATCAVRKYARANALQGLLHTRALSRASKAPARAVAITALRTAFRPDCSLHRRRECALHCAWERALEFLSLALRHGRLELDRGGDLADRVQELLIAQSVVAEVDAAQLRRLLEGLRQ